MYSFYCPQCGHSAIRRGKKAKAEIKAIKKNHRIVHHIPANNMKGLAAILQPTAKAYSCPMVTTKGGTKCRKALVAHVNKIHAQKEKANA